MTWKAHFRAEQIISLSFITLLTLSQDMQLLKRKFFFQIESLGTQVISTTVPAEIAAVAGRETQDGAKRSGSGGFQKFGGVLLIFTGLISAYLSSHELIDVIKTKKSAAVQMLQEKASDIEAKLRPFDVLRD